MCSSDLFPFEQLNQLVSHRLFQFRGTGTVKALGIPSSAQPNHPISGCIGPSLLAGTGVNLAFDGIACDGFFGPALGHHRTDSIDRAGLPHVQHKVGGAGHDRLRHDVIEISFLSDFLHACSPRLGSLTHAR